ncbi:MAG: hypothetical protein ACFCGT_23440 [Sandaracinaceae bacterium]
MAPFLFAALLSGAVVASTASAESQDCMCRFPEIGWSDEHGLPPGALASEAPAVEDDDALSVDGDQLVSQAEEPRPAPVEVRWCIDIDDPRCSPRDHRDEPGPTLARGERGAARAGAPSVPPAGPPTVFAATTTGRGGDEHRPSLDRPPQP